MFISKYYNEVKYNWFTKTRQFKTQKTKPVITDFVFLIELKQPPISLSYPTAICLQRLVLHIQWLVRGEKLPSRVHAAL